MDNLTYILCILALISVFVFIAMDELLPKRLPLHKLRFPRYGIGVGLVGLAVVLLLIPEVYPAVNWEEFKIAYILFFIPFFSLIALGSVCLLLLSLNWGIDIKEDRIVYRNVFRRTRIIYFTEITGIQHREPRFGNQKRSDSSRLFDLADWIIALTVPKKISSYRIYIGKKSITVDSVVYNYDGSAARILKAMKKQGIECPVTTKKTRKPNP